MLRQRRRLAARLAEFTDEEWANQSRCDAWTSQGVITHLTVVNGFWTTSIRAGLAGAPTEFLTTFDPVESPAQLVAANTDSPAETLAAFTASVDVFDELTERLEGADWEALAEAPPGHITVGALAHHALWDSWTHERDILVPLGETVVEEPDEVIACLRYVFAFTAALAVIGGDLRPVAFDVRVENPTARFHVRVGEDVRIVDGAHDADLVVRGRAIDVLEAVSLRRDGAVDVPDELGPILGGLRTTFDQ